MLDHSLLFHLRSVYLRWALAQTCWWRFWMLLIYAFGFAWWNRYLILQILVHSLQLDNFPVFFAPVPTYFECVPGIKFRIDLYFPKNDNSNRFEHYLVFVLKSVEYRLKRLCQLQYFFFSQLLWNWVWTKQVHTQMHSKAVNSCTVLKLLACYNCSLW